MLRRLRVGAGDEHAPIAQVGERVPHLLAVDDPLVAVADCLGGEAGEVAAGAGLTEQLAPLFLAGEHRTEEAILLLVAAVGDDGRAGERHEERARIGGLRAGLAATLFHQPVEIGARTEPAELLGKMHPRQTSVVTPPAELEVLGGCGRVLSQKSVNRGRNLRQLRIVRSAHGRSLAARGVTVQSEAPGVHKRTCHRPAESHSGESMTRALVNGRQRRACRGHDRQSWWSRP